MSRSGYSDDCDNLNLYRASVDRAIGGKRGQAFLREMAAALDAMPMKELVTDVIVQDGAACAIGSVALARKMDLSGLDENEPDEVAKRFGIALAKRRHKLRSECDEIIDIEQGGEIQRLLPTELVKLASPKFKMLARRDLFERKSLQYKMETTEELGRGPLILCVDKSPSMEGDKDVWACAVALALMEVAHRERRTFVLLGFNHEIPLRYAIKPGRPMPEDALSCPCSGGTDITNVLNHSMSAIENNSVARADIIVITDGASNASGGLQIKQRAQKCDARIVGIGIGVKKKALRAWCDVTHSIADTSLDNLDDSTANAMLGD